MIKIIKSKIKNWYYKPRSGRMFGFATWILTNPKALSIVLILGYINAVLIFGILAFVSWWFVWNWLAKGIFTFGFMLTVRNLYRFIKYQWKTGTAVDLNMQEMLNIQGGNK